MKQQAVTYLPHLLHLEYYQYPIAWVVDVESLSVKPPVDDETSLIAVTSDDFALVVKLAKSPVLERDY